MTEYTVHFQKGSRIGERSLRMITIAADDAMKAINAARKEFPDWREKGYRVLMVDHFEGLQLVRDVGAS